MRSVVRERRPGYYHAIEASRLEKDSGACIECTLTALCESVLEQIRTSDEPTNQNEKPILDCCGKILNPPKNEYPMKRIEADPASPGGIAFEQESTFKRPTPLPRPRA